MTSSLILNADEFSNPLDIVETVALDRDWVFERPAESELTAEVSGMHCNYKMWFHWQQEYGGMTLACELDSKLPKTKLTKIYQLLSLVNEKLWLGHFDVSSEDGSVTFRQTWLLRDGATMSQPHMQELMDIALQECERFYPAFQSLVWGDNTPQDALRLAMFETVGEA